MKRNLETARWISGGYRMVGACLVSMVISLASYAAETEQAKPEAVAQVTSSEADWVPLSPGGGGWCMGVYPHPTNPDIVWMNTDISGLFKSIDGGTSYKRVSDPIHLATGAGHVFCGNYSQFAIDPTSTNVCFFTVQTIGRGVSKNGLWKSVDDGENWSYISGTEALVGASLTVSPDGTLYCIERGSKKIHVSTDKGKTFTVKETLPFTASASRNAGIQYKSSIRMAASKSNRLYVLNPVKPVTGLYYTEDKGDHWQSVAAFENQTAGAIACSPSNPDLVFAVTSDGAIYRALDGKNFELCSAKLNVRGYTGISYGVGVGISKSGRVVAWGNGMKKPLISDDNGITFSDTLAQLPSKGDYLFASPCPEQVTSYAASPCSDRFYKTTGVTVWRSLDNGINWEARVNGIEILCLEAPPVPDIADPNRVYFLAGDVGYYFTPDLGKTWKVGNIDTTFCQAGGLTQDPSDANVLYRVWSPVNRPTAPCYLYKSSDRGVTWNKIETADMGSRYRTHGSLLVDSANPKHIYYTSTIDMKNGIPAEPFRGMLESTDGGTTFKVMPGSPWGLHKLIQAKSGNLYAVQGLWGGAIFKYDVKSGKWTAIYAEAAPAGAGGTSGKGANDVAITVDEKTILVADYYGNKLMLSTDSGATWKALKDWENRDICAQSVYIDPIKPNVMLTCAHNLNGGAAGILRSLDGGKTWHAFQDKDSPPFVAGFAYGGVPGRVWTFQWFPTAAKIENVYAPLKQ